MSEHRAELERAIVRVLFAQWWGGVDDDKLAEYGSYLRVVVSDGIDRGELLQDFARRLAAQIADSGSVTTQPPAQPERVRKAIDEWYTSVYYAHKVSVPSPLRDRLADLIIRRLWLEDVQNEGSGA